MAIPHKPLWPRYNPMDLHGPGTQPQHIKELHSHGIHGEWLTKLLSSTKVLPQLGIRHISWFSRKQRSVALSSIEAEYMEASLASCEAIWLRKMLTGTFDQELHPTIIY